MNTKRKTAKKMTNRKKVLNLKNRSTFALATNVGGQINTVTTGKTHVNHAVNSYLAHGGTEKDLRSLVVVEMKILGKPTVKTTRDIKIK